MNLKALLLVAGLLIGALIGYLQRPEATEINIGPLQIEVQSDQPARAGSPLTSGQMSHMVIYTLIGGVIGLVIGLAADRRKRG